VVIDGAPMAISTASFSAQADGDLKRRNGGVAMAINIPVIVAGVPLLCVTRLQIAKDTRRPPSPEHADPDGFRRTSRPSPLTLKWTQSDESGDDIK